jgi:hypothetical protein
MGGKGGPTQMLKSTSISGQYVQYMHFPAAMKLEAVLKSQSIRTRLRHGGPMVPNRQSLYFQTRPWSSLEI